MSAEAVKVVVRVRPVNKRELDLRCSNVVKMEISRGQCSIQNPADPKGPPKTFFFDGAYDLDHNTEQIYADIAYPLVEGVTEGYNGTIFAYGQTGCGKSFTMQGIVDPVTQRGIIPRAFDHIFETISVSDSTKFLVHASYLEIYNEETRDLLGKDVKAKLELKEHPEKGVYVAGLSMHKVTNVKDCQVVMERGWKNRSTGATLMNADSSRSHSIFTIYLEMAETDEEGEDHIRAGKLNLVDLAGSERQSKTGSTGDRLKEATKINLSLSALGNVISALVDGKSTHIPYRDSKLTRLLQDSLGGNTKTLMVACLSPADNNYDESLSTLRYANRAKNIQNKPKINEDPKDALLRQYQEEINRLKQMLMGQIPVTIDKQGQDQGRRQSIQEIEKQKRAIEEEKETIKQEYEAMLREKESQYEAEAADKAKLQEDMQRLRDYYDSKISTLDEQYQGLPSSAEVDLQFGDSALDIGTIPVSVKGKEQALPPPEMQGRRTSSPESGPSVLIVNRQGALTPDEHYTAQQLNRAAAQKAVHVGTKQGQQQPAQPMSQEEVLYRLQMLQSGMVGGEKAGNAEVVARRTKKKKHAEERKTRLAHANSDLEDEGIMIGIYESIQDELKVKNKLLEKAKKKNEVLEGEIRDIQSEFEFDRIDYLDTIRRQERQLTLLAAIVDRVQPCIRRDCNYSSIDRIKSLAKYDEEKEEWTIPPLTIERTQLPSANNGRGPGPGPAYQQPVRPESGSPRGLGQDEVDERLYSKLARRPDPTQEYFTSRRASQLVTQTRSSVMEQPAMPPNLPSPGFGMTNGNAVLLEDGELRAAHVHGQLGQMVAEEPLRRPTRLEALPTPQTAGRRGRKKRNGQMDELGGGYYR